MTTPSPAAEVDLRSDTVTRPDEGMRQAMALAEVGDDVYGEDPTIAALEERVAALLGKESALFCVSGSMANLLATTALVRPGEELLCESEAHVVRAEVGSHGALGGLTTRTWRHPSGHVDLDTIMAMAAPDPGPHLVRTAAVSVENTHNFAGGTIQPAEALAGLRAFADDAGLRLHCDGARLWEAAAASGVSPAGLAAPFDMVSVCLSKGLGAPVGSLVTGPVAEIAAARVRRKRLGGGWRQAGLLAAAGLYALDHNLTRLPSTHAAARALARACAEALPGCVDPSTVETNIVVLDMSAQPPGSAARVVEETASAGVRLSAIGPRTLRMVTHIDVGDDQIARAAHVVPAVLASIAG